MANAVLLLVRGSPSTGFDRLFIAGSSPLPYNLLSMRLLAEGDAGPGRVRPIRSLAVGAAVVIFLLGLPGSQMRAHAQELLGPSSESAADGTAVLPRAELPLVDASLSAGIDQRSPDANPPQPDLFPLPRIDWATVSRPAKTIASGLADLAAQQPVDQTLPPAHTGLKALVFETGSDYKAFPRRVSTWVILAIGGGAAALAHPADVSVTRDLAGSAAVGRFFTAGKWIGADYVQGGAAVGLYVVGRYMLPRTDGEPKSNKVSHLGFDLLRALIVSQSLTQGIKVAAGRNRPTGECCSFPSGHASATFATAAVLERHLGYRGAWPTFVVASYVAASRLHDQRHYLSDVLFGGALGIASGWTVVGRHGRSSYALAPVPVPGGFMVSITHEPARGLR
jgi:membrane-associated phospholipid phosphatase